jgi:hypothetical protein
MKTCYDDEEIDNKGIIKRSDDRGMIRYTMIKGSMIKG